MPKTKQKIAKLPQSGAGNDLAVVVDLQPDEIGLYTGEMGGCCSVVVLWDFDDPSHQYRQVRGQHGAGGPQALDWDQLLQGVPLDVSSRIVVAFNADDLAEPKDYPGKVKAKLKALGYAGPRTFSSEGCVLIDRTGAVTALDPTDSAAYAVRTPPPPRHR